jgi:type I restriction enzyme S subunit
VTVEPNISYQEIGIRSHGKGIFHKEPIQGVSIGNKSVFWVQYPALIFNIVFAWEQAVAVTSEREQGMIASHRFPMYKHKRNDVDLSYVCYFFLTKRGKHLLGLASPGGAGRNKTLGQGELYRVPMPHPPLSEQKKIAEILSAWDEAIEQTRKLIDAKKRRKKALMQQLLTGKKRLSGFSKSKGRNSYRFFDLPEDWKCPQIRDVAQEYSERNTGRDDLTVLSCSKHLGFVESSEYFGKQVFSADTSNYKVIHRNYFGYPSNHIEEGSIGLLLSHDIGIVSPIYTVFKCNDSVIPEYLYAVFKTVTFKHIFAISTNASVDRRGSLRWREFSLIRVPQPSLKEQQAIVDVHNAADSEINQLDTKLKALEKQKRGLMQKLLTGEVRVSA